MAKKTKKPLVTRETLLKAGVAERMVDRIMKEQDDRIEKEEKKAPKKKHRSKLEAEFEQVLKAQKAKGEIIDYWYEPASFKLCEGKRYRPDFVALIDSQYDYPYLVVYEVKGSWKGKNQRDAHTHLKWFVQLYGEMFHSVQVVTKEKGKWVFTEVTA